MKMKFTSPKNLISHPDCTVNFEQVEYYKKLIRQEGKLPESEAVVIDKAGVVLQGSAQLEASLAVGLKTVPFSIEQERLLREPRSTVINLDYTFEFPKICLDKVIPDDYLSDFS